MNRIIFTILLSTSILPAFVIGQNVKEYDIFGRMEGVPEGFKVCMEIFNIKSWDLTGDTAVVGKNGEFHLKGVIPSGGPRYYLMSIGSMIGDRWKAVRMMIGDNEKITITCKDVAKINHQYIDQFCSIQGSPANYSREILFPSYYLWYQTDSRLNNYLAKLQDSIGFDRSAVDAILEAKKQLNLAFYSNIFESDEPNRVPSMPWWAWFWSEYTHDSLIVSAYNCLTLEQKKTFYGKLTKEKTRFCEGQPFPDCSLPSPDGKMISLQKDIISKSKITLVHFWAYNSVSKKELQEELRSLYKHYHDRGFNIIGISSDHRESLYKQALVEEKYPWLNVSDLKGEDGVVNTLYHEYGVEANPNTTNVLIDENGKIIAWDVYGMVLQWNLWKYFDRK